MIGTLVPLGNTGNVRTRAMASHPAVPAISRDLVDSVIDMTLGTIRDGKVV